MIGRRFVFEISLLLVVGALGKAAEAILRSASLLLLLGPAFTELTALLVLVVSRAGTGAGEIDELPGLIPTLRVPSSASRRCRLL